MQKIFWTMILFATLSASLQASAQTMCDAWRKEWGKRTEVFNIECVSSSVNYTRRDYCKREAAALDAERFKILHQCRR
jgi:hypothetical protein